MRLLQLQDGFLSLTDDLIQNVPPYGILSHTWGEDKAEVHFDDIKSGVKLQAVASQHREKQLGYRKIQFCGLQAMASGLRFFWVDTCCIDKSNSAELSEAINSMFRWYMNAKECYVYLSDVSTENCRRTDKFSLPWMQAFRESRWFTRGWTLQELLAPSSVTFFSVEGDKLGDKKSLEREIHEISTIAVTAIRGRKLSEFTILERIRWSDTRATTREEDLAYCLLGLLDVSMPPIYGEEKSKAFARLYEAVENRWGEPCLTPSRHAVRQKTHFIVPLERNESFIGREDILTKLISKIRPNSKANGCQKTALEGLGGIGKTQIALEAAYRLRDMDPECSVFWIPAVTLATFENSCLDIGRALKLPGVDNDKSDIKTLIKSALSREDMGSWLLVVDNADNANLVAGESDGPSLGDYMPSSPKGSILFTTRNHAVPTRLGIRKNEIMHLSEMTEEEARNMLQNDLDETQLLHNESTKALLELLTYLPLAIKQASSFMAENGISTNRYLEHCVSSDKNQIKLLGEDFEDQGRYPDIANPIATTWLISFTQIAERDPLAARYLKFICFLAERDIPISLLPPANDGVDRDKAIGVLKAYAFVTEREDLLSLDIHRLVRLATRNWIKDEWTELSNHVIHRLSSVYPFPRHENRHVWLRYMPHAREVLGVHTSTAKMAEWQLLHNVAESYMMTGKYKQSEHMYRRAWELGRTHMGRENRMTLASINNLAIVLYSGGKYSEAEQLHRQTLKLRGKILGREHPDTLNSMNNLALVLDNQQKHIESEKMHRQTLDLRKRVLGGQHPKTLCSINGLALALNNQGRYKESEQLQRRALQGLKTVLGDNASFTLDSMNNLALVLDGQGKHDQAAQINQQTLLVRQEVLGKEHPRTLESIHNLAEVFRHRGNYPRAEELHRQALTLRERVLGRQHPKTIQSRRNLLHCLNYKCADGNSSTTTIVGINHAAN